MNSSGYPSRTTRIVTPAIAPRIQARLGRRRDADPATSRVPITSHSQISMKPSATPTTLNQVRGRARSNDAPSMKNPYAGR